MITVSRILATTAILISMHGWASAQAKLDPAKLKKAIDKNLGSKTYTHHLVAFVCFDMDTNQLPNSAHVRFKSFSDRDEAAKAIADAYEHEVYSQVVTKLKDGKDAKAQLEKIGKELEERLASSTAAPVVSENVIDRKKYYTGLRYWLPANVVKTMFAVNKKCSLAVGKLNISTYIGKVRAGSNGFGMDVLERKVKAMNKILDD